MGRLRERVEPADRLADGPRAPLQRAVQQALIADCVSAIVRGLLESMRLLALFFPALLFAACSSSTEPIDATAEADAQPSADAGTDPDAESTDRAPPADAGFPDAISVDAAAPRDAAVAPDAAVFDGSLAGTPLEGISITF